MWSWAQGMSELARQELRVARKQHTCVECGALIPIGTRYQYAMGKERGERLWQVHLCLQCNQDWNELMCIEDPDGLWDLWIVYGNLRDRIDDAFNRRLIGEDHPLVQRWVSRVWKDPSPL